MNILSDIYYNPGEKFKKNNIFFMNNFEIDKYINDFNKNNKTNFDINYVKKFINLQKKTPNKLYNKEYNQPSSKEFLNNFCTVENLIDKDLGNNRSPDIFRLLSYNIHSFINSCMSYKKNKYNLFEDIENTNIDSRNVTQILDLCKQLKPDILAFQEYSPVVLENNTDLNLLNFPNYYTKNIDSSMKNNLIYSKNKDIVFLGNLLITKFEILEEIKKSYYDEKRRDNRPFIGYKLRIKNGDKFVELLMFNIHPSPEYDIENLESINFNQINKFINEITELYPSHKNNIIICGDYNNHHIKLKKLMKDKLFIPSHEFYNINPNLFTGYHGTYIDYVYLSYNFLYDFSIINTQILNFNYSDHYPIIFDFRINNKQHNKIQLDTLNTYWLSISRILYKEPSINMDNILNIIHNNMKEFISADSISKLLGKNIVKIPKGTYLLHSTGTLLDNKLFELEDNKKIMPKSFTFLNYPTESLHNYYGIESEYNIKRLLIYKVTKDINCINIYNNNDNNNDYTDKLYNRLECYYKLYQYFKDRFNLPNIDYIFNKNIVDANLKKNILEDKLDYGHGYSFINKNILNNNTSNFNLIILYDVMRLMWIIINEQILININKTDDKYNENMFYGFILFDACYNDSSIFKLNKNTNNIINFPWAKLDESIEGIEIQLLESDFCTKLDSIYFKNKFYSVNEWKNESIKLLDNLQNVDQKKIINLRKNILPNNYQYNKIIKRNTIYYLNFILNYVNSKYYNNHIDNELKILFNNILPHNDIRLSIANKYNSYFTINLLLNDYLKYLLNTKYFYPLDIDNKENIKINPTNFDDLNIYSENKHYEEIFKSMLGYVFKLYIKYNNNKIFKYVVKRILICICKINKTLLNDEPINIVNNIIKNKNLKVNEILQCYISYIKLQ
jgi:endonuclease/exonuclease/phosphatase family metal-dependent hydrolase